MLLVLLMVLLMLLLLLLPDARGLNGLKQTHCRRQITTCGIFHCLDTTKAGHERVALGHEGLDGGQPLEVRTTARHLDLLRIWHFWEHFTALWKQSWR